MTIVLTVDQRGSRRGPDQVDAALELLRGVPVTCGFERTAWDEFQGVPATPLAAVTATLELLRAGHWSVGLGIGPVETPLPVSTRAGRGAAFVLAREAVEAARRLPQHVAVRSTDAAAAQEIEAMLGLLAAVLAARSTEGWQAIDLVGAGADQRTVATKLGISAQAVSQRLAAARRREELAARTALVTMLARADSTAVASAG